MTKRKGQERAEDDKDNDVPKTMEADALSQHAAYAEGAKQRLAAIADEPAQYHSHRHPALQRSRNVGRKGSDED